MAVYGYARVSTTRQAEDGESLEVQQRTIAGYAMMHGMAIDSVFVERGVSGSKPLAERPEGAALLASVKLGDAVITAKLDRMFRSALDALDVLGRLKDRGVNLHMVDLGGDVTGNGISKLVFTILSAVAEAERDRIRERIVDVKADQKKRGRYLGGIVPFGWCIGEDRVLVKVPEQQQAIERMLAMHDAGKSLREIAATMTSNGHRLSHEGVKKIIKAERDRMREKEKECGVIDMTFAVAQAESWGPALLDGTYKNVVQGPDAEYLHWKAVEEARQYQARKRAQHEDWNSVGDDEP